MIQVRGLQFTRFKGGPGDPGSGHHGHAGRPGDVGGSIPSSNLPAQWTSTLHKENGRIDSDKVASMVEKAIEERPSRATHGYTAKNAFFIVDDEIYAWNDYNKIPEGKRSHAIPVHSHGPENWEEFPDLAFNPHNSADVHLWVNDFKKGRMGSASALIMPDGRMEILEILPSTKGELFKLGAKKLERVLSKSYAERSAYWEQHKNDPDWHTYKLEQELLRGFAKEYGLGYLEGVGWGK